ncbi:MAG: PspC domain-containing protein [Anaerolineaceae bacterium]|nr:MAG: PspC domain-containing protein [Anaerolineaceae bacterium]
MTRSFTDRVFGGVCGGLAAKLPISAWVLRVVFIVLTPLSLGLAALVYAALWWILPQESLIADVGGGLWRFMLALIVVGGSVALWLGRDADWLAASDGASLFFPALFLLFSVVFLIRQIGTAS